MSPQPLGTAPRVTWTRAEPPGGLTMPEPLDPAGWQPDEELEEHLQSTA